MSNIPTGIDLGTSNSVIGVFKNGKINIVPNSIGDPLTPSIVEILDKGEAIGEEIMLHKMDEKNTIREIKRLIGKKYSELKDIHNLSNIILSKNDTIKIKINRNGNEEFFTPEEIMSLIFKKLIKSASDFMEINVKKAVITVPAYFDYNQRSAIVESAKLAGIEVLRIINEPTAAALAYGLGTKENLSESLALSIIKEDNIKERKVLVFDLGGGTFDITILILENSKFNVKASLGDTHLGGIDFDNKLVDFCLKNFCIKMNFNEDDIRKDSHALKRLKIQCEKAKKRLTNNKSTTINIINFFNNMNLNVEITRDRFNEGCEKLFNKIKEILDKVLKESKFSVEEINDVILVGGSSRIPKIKEILGDKFGKNKIRDNINQDEAVAIGATWQAHKLLKSEGNINVLDITPFSLGVCTVSQDKEEQKHGYVMSFLIKKNTKIPTKSKTEPFKTVINDQTFFNIRVYSGEDKYCKNNKLLKQFIINDLPKGEKGSVSLTLNFEIDVNGILTVEAEVDSIGKKVFKYSLYESENLNPKSINHKISSKDIKQLNEIKEITEFINQKNEDLKNTNDLSDKNDFLNDLCKSCSDLLNIYENLNKDNDSEKLYEKIFDYTKVLFNYYFQKIKLNNDNQIISEIINKIEKIIPKFINDNIENLIDIFDELKTIKPKIYCEIILFCVEILYQEGDRILDERKKYARYYSKKFYQKAETIKKYIDANLEKKMDHKLNKKYKDITKNYESKVAEIESFANIIKNQVDKKESPYIGTGFTKMDKYLKEAIEDEDHLHQILDIYQEMADSLKKGPLSEAEAFCLTNIIKINFTFLKNYDFDLYDGINERIEYIYDKLFFQEERPEPEWHQKLMEINKDIDNVRNSVLSPMIPNFEKDKALIKDYFNQKINDKPIEFLYFIIEKYPCVNFDPSTMKQKNFKELFKEIFAQYQPDNYKKDKKDLYQEIYILLVEIEKKYFKS